MAKKFDAKKGDTYLNLRVSANLTGSTVRVIVRPIGTTTPLPDLAVTITNAAKGEIRISIGTLPVGVYELEVEQTQGGTVAHYPRKGYDILIIGEDLDV